MYVHMHPRACTFMYTCHIKGNNFPVLPMHPITGCIWEYNLTWGMALETGNYLKASSGVWKTRGSTDIKKLLVTKRKEEVNGGEYQMRALVGTVRGVGGILSSSISSSLELFCICWSLFFPNVMFPALCLGPCTHTCSGLQNARAPWQAELQATLAPSLQTAEKGEIFDKFVWIWSRKWCTDDPSSCRWKFL